MKDLTTGNEGKNILRFTIPILIGNIFQQLYNVIDSIVIGNCLGKNSLAAVSASLNIVSIILLIAIGLTLGTNILIARYYGERSIDKVKKTIDTAFIFAVILAITITVLGIVFSKNILYLFKIPFILIPEARIFLVIMFSGTLASFGYNTIASILRGLGDSKTPLYFLVISALLNIILDLIFIFICKTGSWGAALATVIAQTFSFLGSFIYFNKLYPSYRIKFKKLNFDIDVLKRSMKIGFPAAMQKVFVSGGFIIIQILINGYGSNSIAAFAAAGKIDAFAQMPALNLGDALSVFTAQNLGANKPNRVKKGYKATLLISTVICLSITILVSLFSKNLMKLFVQDNLVINIGVRYLTVVSLFYIIYSAMNVTNGVLLGYGSSFVPMLSTIISLWCVQIPVSLILSYKLGVSGIWLGIPAGWVSGFAVRFIYYKNIEKIMDMKFKENDKLYL